MRHDERRRALQRPRLVAEDIALPVQAVVAAGDLQFLALGLHVGKDVVGVADAVARPDRSERIERFRQWTPCQHGKHLGQAEDEDQQRRCSCRHSQRSPGQGRRRGGNPPLADAPRHDSVGDPVVQQKQAQQDRQQVDEVVVAGGEDRQLHEDRHRRGEDAERTRQEDEERNDQLREKGEADAGLKQRFRQLVRVPRADMRQRLGLEIVVEGGEAAPRRIAARQLGKSRQEAQPEQQPVVKQHHQPRRRTGQEDREEAAFQQQVVPLEVHEHLSGMVERKVEHEQQDQDEPLPAPAQQQEKRQQGSGQRCALQGNVAAVEPEQRRHLQPGGMAVAGEAALQKLAQRQNAAGTGQALDLRHQGGEGGEVDQRQALQEQPGGQFVVVGGLEQIAQERRQSVHEPRPRNPGVALRHDYAAMLSRVIACAPPWP